ncbi:MAG: hypothetical protein ACFCVE_06355 [Phycisphaerae bacterium]
MARSTLVSCSVLAAVVLVSAGGFATTPEPVPELEPVALSPRSGPTAAALAFAPPIERLAPPLDLSRQGRAEAAFFGFAGVQTESFYIRTDDRVADLPFSGRFGSVGPLNLSRYERRAVTTRTGVVYR